MAFQDPLVLRDEADELDRVAGEVFRAFGPAEAVRGACVARPAKKRHRSPRHMAAGHHPVIAEAWQQMREADGKRQLADGIELNARRKALRRIAANAGSLDRARRAWARKRVSA